MRGRSIIRNASSKRSRAPSRGKGIPTPPIPPTPIYVPVLYGLPIKTW